MRLIYAGLQIIAGMIGIGLGCIAENVWQAGHSSGMSHGPGWGSICMLAGFVVLVNGLLEGFWEKRHLNKVDL